MPDPRYTQLAMLDGLGIELPPAVTGAIRAFTAAGALRVPAPPRPGVLVRQAVTAEADRLARKAAESARPSFDLGDVSAITAARAAEQAAADRQALAAEVRDAAALVLAGAVAGNRADLIAAIQAKHGALAADLVKRARRLPPGASETSALEAGGQHRADFLACRDHAAGLARLRDGLRLVDDRPPPEPDDGVAFCSAWEQTGKLAAAWLAREGTTVYGPLGSLEFWLSAAREDGDRAYQWWLPTSAQQSARIAALRTERHAQQVVANAL
jgi:hypothetical protein